MEEVGSDGASSVSPLAKWRNDFSRTFQYYLDKSSPHIVKRWLGTLAAAAIYVLRVYYIQGFYVISYGLGIYMLNLLIGFMSPKVDPEVEVIDGASLPTKETDEFRPFVRRLPEFKFWYATTKAFCVAFLMTFFSIFDVPVFWPILFFYWFFLFFLTMKRQITHMIKYRYVPFNFGKQKLPFDFDFPERSSRCIEDDYSRTPPGNLSRKLRGNFWFMDFPEVAICNTNVNQIVLFGLELIVNADKVREFL
ncbi:UNVERIFIED_CONTAM: protein RER1A [Sesamum radiatum]|uniref:Protein RER1A n=1 Tax=Sesamum radiatum TaxID=300843 RepID=A0AAW2PYR9_SESRA